MNHLRDEEFPKGSGKGFPSMEQSKLGDVKLRKADETIFKAISLKLDLMKDGIEGGGENVPKKWGKLNRDDYTGHSNTFYHDRIPQTKEGQAADERGMNAKERDYSKRLYGGDKHHGRVPREHRDKPYAKPPVTKPYKGKKPDPRIDENKLSEKERTKIETTVPPLRDASSPDTDYTDRQFTGSSGSPKDLREKASETVFKAISLKLDLMKVSSFKGSTKLPKVPSVKLNTSTSNWNDSKVDPDDYEDGKPIDWGKRHAEQIQNDNDEADANYYDSLEYDGRN